MNRDSVFPGSARMARAERLREMFRYRPGCKSFQDNTKADCGSLCSPTDKRQCYKMWRKRKKTQRLGCFALHCGTHASQRTLVAKAQFLTCHCYGQTQRLALRAVVCATGGPFGILASLQVGGAAHSLGSREVTSPRWELLCHDGFCRKETEFCSVTAAGMGTTAQSKPCGQGWHGQVARQRSTLA